MNEEESYLTLPDRRLAYQLWRAPVVDNAQKKLPVVFLGGYASTMQGTKASFLAQEMPRQGRDLTRFDYRGRGGSSGRFEDITIGDCLDDALHILDRLTQGPQILIGSSMGGWIGLLLARARPERVAAFIGVAAAPDFTEDLVRPALSAQQKAELETQGFTHERDETGQEGGPPLTRLLMEEAKNHLVLTKPLALPFPVHLLQGKADHDVPWRHALKIMDKLDAPHAHLTLLKDAKHNLNRPEDLALLSETIQRAAQEAGETP